VRRTLFLVENNSVPGDTRVWLECCTLRDAGWDVVVVCPRGSDRDNESEVTIDGIEIHRFDPVEGTGQASAYVREYAVALVRITALVRRIARGRRFHVVHASNPPDILLACGLPLGRRTVRVFDHHDLSPELYEAKFARRGFVHGTLLAAERVGFSMADVVISTNESFRDIAVSRGHKSPEQIFVVRNGPDTRLFKPVDPDAELRSRAKYVIGYVGLMGAQDGIDEALQSLAVLSARRSDWHGVFVGDGERLHSARLLAMQLGIADRVTFEGYVADPTTLVQAIASFDVCLSPEPRNALNELSTFIKVAEYMAVGRPVVAFNLRETRHTANDAAAYATGDDAKAFAHTIDGLLDDQARREAMGAYGRRRVANALAWSHSERALLAAYEYAFAQYGKRTKR